MKIWVTTDLHFRQSQFKFLVAHQNEYDVLTINGDLLKSPKNFEAETIWINQTLAKINKPIFICSGNHDLDQNMDCHWLHGDNLILDNRIKTIEGIKFGVVPYMGADFTKFYNCDIVLYHIPPKNTKTSKVKGERFTQDSGCEAVYQALKHNIIKPKYLLCGHLHKTLDIKDTINKTVIINPNANPSRDEPLVYKLDFKKG